jgi:hypothetical protein
MKVSFTEGALPYAETLGWSVFPLASGGKLPAIRTAHPKGDPQRGSCQGECGREGHGVYDATADPEKIRAWGRRFPRANIGLPCGTANGFLVLDIDPRAGGDQTIRALAAQGNPFPTCPRQRTGNGGYHLLFRFDASLGKPRGKLGQGVDVKASGGYILAAPSVTAPSDAGPGGPYRWEVSPFDTPIPPLPAWMRAILYPPPPKPQPWQPSGPQDIRPLADFVASAPNGNRNNALYWAARRAVEAGALTPSAQHSLLSAAVAAGLERGKALATIQSAANRDMRP